MSPRRRAAKHEEPGALARILYRMRAETNLTQKEVQRRAGWADGNSYYSDIERGNIRLPGKDKIADLERAFGVEPGSIEDQLPRRERFMLAPPSIPNDAIDILPDPNDLDRLDALDRLVEKLALMDLTELGRMHRAADYFLTQHSPQAKPNPTLAE